MIKLAAAFLLFFISFLCIIIYLAGMHGHLMFRPHMTEDWIVWGIATITFLGGLAFLIRRLKGSKHQ